MDRQENGIPEESAFSRAEGLLRDYGGRARKLKTSGARLIGYQCAYVPLEIISAAGLVPFRIGGNPHDPVTDGNTRMETIVCPVVRSSFDQAVKGNFAFLDGIVLPHSCDSMCITHDVWRSALNLPFFHVLNYPHSTNGGARDFFKQCLRTFILSLERFTGRALTPEATAREVGRYNRYRAAARRLYRLRQTDPPRLSGSETVTALLAAAGLPPEEGVALLTEAADEASKRPPRRGPARPRLLLCGSEQDDPAFMRMVEECGGEVVADYLCPGMREYGTDVEITPDPLDGLAARYLDLNCARTFREGTSREEGLELRFGAIGRIARDWRAQGVVFRVHRCCDPYGLEAPALLNYLKGRSLPVLYLEDDYSVRDTGRLRTRLQAFLELADRNGKGAPR
jgi:benzoyl-CoA reductase/2-hydroxyglutaryl-CoA dehydratase subunit BcrC/BadD/HgdB